MGYYYNELYSDDSLLQCGYTLIRLGGYCILCEERIDSDDLFANTTIITGHPDTPNFYCRACASEEISESNINPDDANLIPDDQVPDYDLVKEGYDPGYKTTFHFIWYDFWIGFFWDQRKRTLYVCPLPMCVIKIQWGSIEKIGM